MKQILIADDQEEICTMIRALFRDRPDYHFETAQNGLQALEKAGRCTFDLVITDVIMPDCDGIELIMKLRRTKPDLKIMVMSGGGRVRAEHYLGLAEKLGAARVFEKPVDPFALKAAVDEALAGPAEQEKA